MPLVQAWADETQHIFQPPMPDRRALMQLAMGQGQKMLALELYVSKPCMSIVRLYRGAANKAQINDDTLSFEVATLPGGVGSLRPSLEMDTGQLRLHFMTLERGLIPEVEWGRRPAGPLLRARAALARRRRPARRDQSSSPGRHVTWTETRPLAMRRDGCGRCDPKGNVRSDVT